MLRDEIAKIIDDESNFDYDCEFMNLKEVVDSILSLPSGVEAVSKCPKCSNIRGPKLETCLCHGSGSISRDVPIGEAIKLLKEIINDLTEVVKESPFTDDGETLRVKKER